MLGLALPIALAVGLHAPQQETLDASAWPLLHDMSVHKPRDGHVRKAAVSEKLTDGQWVWQPAVVADMQAENATEMSPPPPPMPPLPPACDQLPCGQWEGPQRMVYVAPMYTASATVIQLLNTVHKHTGMPYAWGGRHAGWLHDAKARDLECAKEVDTRLDPANGDARICRCFLEYLDAYNLTAEGLWICHDTICLLYTSPSPRD